MPEQKEILSPRPHVVCPKALPNELSGKVAHQERGTEGSSNNGQT
jgi:hypothetical protein